MAEAPAHLAAALQAIEDGSATPDHQQVVFAAFRSGAISLATGDAAVSVGGDATGAQIITAAGDAFETASAPGHLRKRISWADQRLISPATTGVCGGDKLVHGSGGFSDAGEVKLCHL